MERDREFDEVLRKKISETLGEQIDESVDADDLMFDLGMRYLRMMAKKKRKDRGKESENDKSVHGRPADVFLYVPGKPAQMDDGGQHNLICCKPGL